MQAKSETRDRMLRARLALEAGDARARSLRIEANLLSLPWFARAGTIMFYAPYRGEVDVSGAIASALLSGKRVALPRIRRKRPVDERAAPNAGVMDAYLIANWPGDAVSGAYGILEPGSWCPPVEPPELELVVVPGVAFDRLGFRLGYGGGYYDRFLGQVRPGCPAVGVAFDLQVVPELPRGEHDRRVDAVVTESEIIYPPQSKINCVPPGGAFQGDRGNDHRG